MIVARFSFFFSLHQSRGEFGGILSCQEFGCAQQARNLGHGGSFSHLFPPFGKVFAERPGGAIVLPEQPGQRVHHGLEVQRFFELLNASFRLLQ